MPETIDLLLRELKLPTFLRHYQRHQEQTIAPPAKAGGFGFGGLNRRLK